MDAQYTVRVFVSYAALEQPLFEELRDHLAPLVESKQMSLWARLEEADLVLVLLSRSYLSDKLYLGEAKRALERHDAEQAEVVPVLVRPVTWQDTPLAVLEPLPKGGRTFVASVVDRDACWVDVVAGIREVAQRIASRPPPLPRSQPVEVPRAGLEERLVRRLQQQRRLLVLAPRSAGADGLARRVAEAANYGAQVTWLRPFSVTACDTSHYFAMLTGDAAVRTAYDYVQWQRRAASDAAAHLVVLQHDGGPVEHLRSLGAALRHLLEQSGVRFSVLAAGGAAAAALRFQSVEISIFAGIDAEHLPDLTEPEVAALLQRAGRDRAAAPALWRVTGGHPGWVTALLQDDSQADEPALTQHLARSALVRGALLRRLKEDESLSGSRSQSVVVLRSLLNGRSVEPLLRREDDLRWAEVRLYYDGLLRASAAAQTEFRSEAVRLAVAEELS